MKLFSIFNNKHRPSKSQHIGCVEARGFLLLELSIALSFSVVLMTVFAFSFFSALAQRSLLLDKLRALMSARSKIECVLAEFPWPSHERFIEGEYTIEIDIVPDNTVRRYHHVTVTVYWPPKTSHKGGRMQWQTGIVR